MRRIFGLMVVICLGGQGHAQMPTARALLEALSEGTPGETLQEMRGNPDAFLEEAAGVVLGYGEVDGIDRQGLEDAVDAARARTRAREIRRLLSADLNADLMVDQREIGIAIQTASATMRGRLLTWHLAADLDEDGTVGWDELRTFAEKASLRALSSEKAEAIRALMVFDLDGDDLVTVKELRDAIALLSDPV